VKELGDRTLKFCFGNKEAAQCTVSFLGIHKWEPDIYIGFSPALHLQCITVTVSRNKCLENLRNHFRVFDRQGFVDAVVFSILFLSWYDIFNEHDNSPHF
jgi:hypothetical protein